MWKYCIEESWAHLRERPEVAVHFNEFASIWAACAAWRRLRKQGVSDESILELYHSGAHFIYDELLEEANEIAEMIEEDGEVFDWYYYALIQRGLPYHLSGVPHLVRRLIEKNFSAIRIGNLFASDFSAPKEGTNTTGD